MDQSPPARPVWTSRRRTLAWLVCVAVGSVLLLAAVYRLTVHTVPGRLLGDVALRGANLTETPLAQSVRSVLDVVTLTSVIAAIALIALIALIRLRRAQGLAAIGVLVGASILSRILKSYVLTRPDLGLAESTPATLNSLPSGHTTAAFSIGVALLFVVPTVLRPVTAGAGLLFSSAVALATMSAGWHRAADSVASFLLVTACAAFAGLAVLITEPGGDSAADPAVHVKPGKPGRALGVIAWGLFLLAGLLTALVSWQRLRESVIGPPTAFMASGLLLIGAAAMATMVAWRIVERVAPEPAPDPVPVQAASNPVAHAGSVAGPVAGPVAGTDPAPVPTPGPGPAREPAPPEPPDALDDPPTTLRRPGDPPTTG